MKKKQISEMGKFACKLHLIANFGSASDKALKIFEHSVTNDRNPHSFDNDESGTFRLARTAAKALTKRGSDKPGIGSFWNVFLKGRETKNHLVTFHGHRINIAFHDCAAVYFHKNDILDILKDWPEPNGLLKYVLFDIKANLFLAGARAMGIFDKLVTAQFWKLLENKGSILDLSDHLLHMKVSLMQWSNDGSEQFSGSQMFSQNVVDIDKDELYYELFKETNDPQLDSFTQIALELLSAQFLIILERQASTQLPGGVYWTPSQYTEEMNSNDPKTNTISERDMAILDNLLKVKPSAFVTSGQKTFGTYNVKEKNKNNTFKKENKPWFDLDCRLARQNYRKLKKHFKRSTSPQNRLAMIDAEKHYKHTLDRK